MFWKTKPEVQAVQEVEQPSTAVTVEVKDIKQHLVDAYEESKHQRDKIDELNREIDALSEDRTKYRATLVTLDEYSRRIEEEKERNQSLNSKLENRNQKIEDLQEQVNNYKIAQNSYKRDRFKIENQIKTDYLNSLKKEILNVKGHISKQMIIDLLNSLEVTE